MLPDFQSVKDLRLKRFRKLVWELTRAKSPMTRQMRHWFQHEGSGWKADTLDGHVDERGFQTARAGFELSFAEMEGMDDEKLVEVAHKYADQFSAQQEKMIFKLIDEITAQTGNVIKGKPMGPQVIAEVLQRMPIDFDERGEPDMPAIVTSPAEFEKIRQQLPSWEQDAEAKQKIDRILEQKRIDFRDRESDRKLAD